MGECAYEEESGVSENVEEENYGDGFGYSDRVVEDAHRLGFETGADGRLRRAEERGGGITGREFPKNRFQQVVE